MRHQVLDSRHMIQSGQSASIVVPVVDACLACSKALALLDLVQGIAASTSEGKAPGDIFPLVHREKAIERSKSIENGREYSL